jgi:hypothetical protein
MYYFMMCTHTASHFLNENGDDSDIEGGDLKARIRHRRKLKRSFIDLTNNDGSSVRVPFHKRKHNGSESSSARETIKLLTKAGVRATNTNLIYLGFGGIAAKAAVQAVKDAAP